MLSWFTRNTSRPSKPPPPEQQPPPPRTEVAPSPIPKENPSSQEPTTHPTPAPTAVFDAPPAATAPTSEQPQKAVFTTALNTPHDAVLAELLGHPTGHDLLARTDATPSTSALGMQSIDTLPPATSEAPASIATSTSPPPEPLQDPFTGMTIGQLSPISSAKTNSTSEELWAHLSRIRSLQADVARLHLTMEGIGLGDPDTPHLRSTSPRPVGERLEDDEIIDGDDGAEAEKRRAREFERSEQKFDRRKEEIGQIMSKLDEVSQALAAFHALETPVFNSAVAAATSHPTTGSSSTPVRRRPTSRPPDLHRVSLEASPRGRDDFLVDSPLVMHETLPSPEEPETRVELAPPNTSVA